MEEKRSAPTKRKASDLSEQTATTAPELSSGSRDVVDNDRKVEEQMERFYALLENIKSMRYAWGGGRGGMSQKKMKVDEKGEPEVPWKPTFRLEDFMQGQDDKNGERRVKKEDGGERSDVES